MNSRNMTWLLAAALGSVAPTVFSDELDRPPSADERYADPGNEMAKSYAADFGISAGEATRILRQQARMGRLTERLKAKYPDTFAGLYAKNGKGFKAIAKFTAAVAPADVATLDADLAADTDTETAQRSLKELEQALRTLVVDQKKAGIKYTAAIDIPGNSVVITVVDRAAFDQAVSAGKVHLPAYATVVQAPTLIEPTAAVYGGRSFVEPDSNYCTTGFTVVQTATNVRGMSTAGHCNNAGVYNTSIASTTTYSSSGGYSTSFKNEWLGNNMDLQWATVSSGSYSNQFWDGTAYVGVTGTIATSVGDYVCKFGRKTGRTCGTVAAYNVWDPDYGYVTKVAPSSGIMNDFGDSGGPVFKGTLAAGWVHGKDASGNMYYTEAYMPESKATGIKVLTTP